MFDGNKFAEKHTEHSTHTTDQLFPLFVKTCLQAVVHFIHSAIYIDMIKV